MSLLAKVSFDAKCSKEANTLDRSVLRHPVVLPDSWLDHIISQEWNDNSWQANKNIITKLWT